MSPITLQKMMYYDAWTQRVLNTNRGAVTYFLNVRLTKTRTLVFRYTRMIGLSIVMLVAVDTTSPKRFPNSSLSRVVVIKRHPYERQSQ